MSKFTGKLRKAIKTTGLRLLGPGTSQYVELLGDSVVAADPLAMLAIANNAALLEPPKQKADSPKLQHARLNAALHEWIVEHLGDDFRKGFVDGYDGNTGPWGPQDAPDYLTGLVAGQEATKEFVKQAGKLRRRLAESSARTAEIKTEPDVVPGRLTEW
jgi:hypothetical protein